MMDGQRRFRVNEPRVLCQQFDQEVAVVHLATGNYHSLSGIAGEAFLILGSAGASRDDVVAELLARYDVSREVIEQDLSVFLEELQSQRLIVPARDGAPRVLKTTTEPAARASYSAPKIETFNDLQELFLLDPVHDVDEAGWPNAAPAISAAAVNNPAYVGDGEIMPASTRCRLAGPNVIFERFDDETVAINVGSGSYHSLNGVAEDIFLLFPYEPTIGEIRAALHAKYAVEEAELESALQAHLNELVDAGLIVTEKSEGSGGRALELSRGGTGVPFSQPVLGVFGQPSFDRFGATPQSNLEPAMESADPSRKMHYAVAPRDLIVTESGGEMVICDRDAGYYFKLNRATTEAFHALLRGSVSDAAAHLQRKYDVAQRDLRSAVIGLIWNLRQLRLVVLTPDESPERTAPFNANGGMRLPFSGFHVEVYRDMEELMRPFNPAQASASNPKHRDRHGRMFTEMLDDYFAEVSAAGASDGVYSVGGHATRIRCAGDAQLAQLRRPFEHLAAAAASPDLTIHVWNCSSLAPGPLLAAPLERLRENWTKVCGPRGELVDFHSDAVSAIFHPGPNVLSVLDLERGHAYFLAQNDDPLPFWELGSPFRHILHRWFASRGLQFTHAAAVGGSCGGVLLAGKGGSGKSTTALLCAAAGLSYVGDDYCLIDSHAACAFSLYNTAKLKGEEDVARVPEVRDRSINSDSFERGGHGKGVFLLADVWPERMTSGFPLRAILLPVITGAPNTRLEACAPSEALLGLAPSTIAQLPCAAQADANRLAALTEKLPAYKLVLGRDLAEIPAAVRRVLE